MFSAHRPQSLVVRAYRSTVARGPGYHARWPNEIPRARGETQVSISTLVRWIVAAVTALFLLTGCAGTLSVSLEIQGDVTTQPNQGALS